MSGMGLVRIAAAEGISAAPRAAAGVSMASRNLAAAAASSPSSRAEPAAGLMSALGAAFGWALGLLSRRLAHLRKLACFAAGEGLSGLPTAAGPAPALTGCPTCDSCSGLLASWLVP